MNLEKDVPVFWSFYYLWILGFFVTCCLGLQCLQNKAVEITSPPVKQDSVVYKKSMPKYHYFITYFNRRLGTWLLLMWMRWNSCYCCFYQNRFFMFFVFIYIQCCLFIKNLWSVHFPEKMKWYHKCLNCFVLYSYVRIWKCLLCILWICHLCTPNVLNRKQEPYDIDRPYNSTRSWPRHT